MKAKVYVTKVRDFKNIFIAVIMNSILNSLIHEKGFFQKKLELHFLTDIYLLTLQVLFGLLHSKLEKKIVVTSNMRQS